jgi:rare lipoprotein A
MKKLLLALTLLAVSSTSTLADEWASNWSSGKPFARSATVSDGQFTFKKTKKTRPVTVRDIPIVGDIVRGMEQGIASFYWQPQGVACGGRFNPEAMTAASKHLKCGTRVRVTNRNNGKSVVVTINDRGPYIKGRIIDLSKAAARQIDMIKNGVVPVTVEVIN